MKKKKQQIDVEGTEPEMDLKSLIHQHSQFFDKLIELIPAKFYLSKDEDKPWFQGLSKAKRDAAKKESRENIKKARRDRLDPDKANVTTLDLLKQNLEKEKQKEESDDDEEEDEEEEEEEEEDDEEEVEINPVISGLKNDTRSATYEDLRERYVRKLKELRGEREANPNSRRQQKREERQEYRSKRKREHGSGGKNAVATKIDIAKNVEKEAEEATKELRFSHVKIGDDDDHRMKKKRKLSKQRELEKAKELQEAKADPEKGTKEFWRAATSKAAGVKVHDDPKLLKQSIKKEKEEAAKER
ncbi:unnamed protein product [Linum tenue]|uniref:Uncharacterized protein n=1 Tax=Linum tenue TaxID=586396 RepID=A0AAV0HDJ6_9ROSI|nr:unnamed protein product [Linum tenue]